MYYVSLNHFSFSGPHNNLFYFPSCLQYVFFFVLGFRTVFVALAGFKSRVALNSSPALLHYLALRKIGFIDNVPLWRWW